ncbi:MAG: hypothetical protein M1822_005236 [Bathelium mastoideum]|nr:MAG: hypothetical protein M1822_005236 [Bathelium mastoideum]
MAPLRKKPPSSSTASSPTRIASRTSLTQILEGPGEQRHAQMVSAAVREIEEARRAEERRQEERDGQQSGRTSSSLHAEKVAAAIREIEKSRRSANAKHVNVLDSGQRSRDTSDSETGVLDAVPASVKSSDIQPDLISIDQERSSPEALQTNGRSYSEADEAPKVVIERATSTSPRRPLRNQFSIDGESSTESNGEARSSSNNIDASGLSKVKLIPGKKAARIRNTAPAVVADSRLKGISDAFRTSTSLPPKFRHPPKSISDLGFDFTRYFNPAGHSRRSSPRPASASTSRKTSVVALPRSYSENQLPSQLKRTESPDVQPVNSAESGKPFCPFLDDSLTGPGVEDSGHTFPLFVSEKELDDDMHMPGVDDDVRYRPRWRDHFSKDNFVSTIGLFLMLAGLIFVFIALPVLSFSGVWLLDYPYVTPLDQMPGYGQQPQPNSWAWVNNNTYPLLQNIRSGLVDPDTPQSAMTVQGNDGEELDLVFSDEFNDQNRTFYPGDDPFFYAFDGWYGATKDLDWYDPDAVTTYDGVLQLQLDKFINHNLNFRSGMLHSWNQLCFKGGRFEVSVSLPGPGGIQGLWPGVWTMGNLGRPGYLATTDGMWPYTYDSCDAGITPNQSDYGGVSALPGQRLPSCTCPGQDHPTPGTGRGAPEIDILEASADQVSQVGLITQSYQVAPFDVWWLPDRQYTEFPDYNLSFPNGYVGGPYQQALSSNTMLNNSWYDGNFYQKYAFEYTPGVGEDGEITWFAADQVTWHMDGRAVGQNGNVGPRLVSEEPMSIIINLGLSTAWSNLDWANLAFPTVMRIDYVRWYQPKGQKMVTCDPPGWETTEYIRQHPRAYNNPNLTVSCKHGRTGSPN